MKLESTSSRCLFGVLIACWALGAVASLSYLDPSSSVDCPLSITAGEPVRCAVVLRGPGGAYVGTASDSCQVLLSWCPSDAGSAHYIRNSTYISPGRYEFIFYPTAAGENKIAVSVRNATVASGSKAIFIHNGKANMQRASSECMVDPATGGTVCEVRHRDTFGNVVRVCQTKYNTEGVPHQTCTAL